MSDAEVREYRENGYLVLEGVLDGERLRDALALSEDVIARASSHVSDGNGVWTFEGSEQDPGRNPLAGRLYKVQGVCTVEPRFLDVAADPDITARLARLIGTTDLDVFGTKFFPVFPGGRSSAWHNDPHFWNDDNKPFARDSSVIVSCAMYFEETDRTNGCLRVVRGSHRSELSVPYEVWADLDEDGLDIVDVECPAGTVVLFDPKLLHGAWDNGSDRTSYRTAWHYIPSAQFPDEADPDRHRLRSISAV